MTLLTTWQHESKQDSREQHRCSLKNTARCSANWNHRFTFKISPFNDSEVISLQGTLHCIPHRCSGDGNTSSRQRKLESSCENTQRNGLPLCLISQGDFISHYSFQTGSPGLTNCCGITVTDVRPGPVQQGGPWTRERRARSLPNICPSFI